MLGEALAYPFVLLRRRPVMVTLCLFAWWAVSVAVDVSLSELSQIRYVNERDIVSFAWNDLLYSTIKEVLLDYPVAVICVFALIDLGCRSAALPPRFSDGLRWAAMGAVYNVLVATPIAVAIHAASLYVEPLRESDTLTRSLFSRFAWVALDTLVLYRLSLAWPHALATRRYILFRGWALSRGHYRQILTVLLPITVAMTFGQSFLLESYYKATEPTRHGLFGLLEDHAAWRAYDNAVIDAMSVARGYIFNIAAAVLYRRVGPPNPQNVAETF